MRRQEAVMGMDGPVIYNTGEEEISLNRPVDDLLAAIGNAIDGKCRLKANEYTNQIRLSYTRPGVIRGWNTLYDQRDLEEALHHIKLRGTFGPLEPGVKEAKRFLDGQAAAQADGTIRMSREATREIAEQKRGRPIKLSDGRVVYMPEDDADPMESGKTSAEKFDAIKSTVAEINLGMIREVGKAHTCQVWATVRDMGGGEHQIVSDEDYTAERFIYSDKGGLNDLAVVMKPCPDQNGKVHGPEVLVTRRDLEDCFPDLFGTIDHNIRSNGYPNFEQFCMSVKTLINGRDAFARALSEMSYSTIAVAREEAVKHHVNEREGFYGSQKGFGQF